MAGNYPHLNFGLDESVEKTVASAGRSRMSASVGLKFVMPMSSTDVG